MQNRTRPFLTAEWRKLAMANFIVDPKILLKYVPDKTELDLWNGKCYVSLVGFMFLNTKLKGISIPLHRSFEEVNLRFYVRHKADGQWKRGVVFVKEIVPRPALTFVAKIFYNEPYETMEMSHHWKHDEQTLSVEYRWKQKQWNSIQVHATNKSIAIESASEEEFITEHYWGYTKVHESRTSEYEVAHPRWNIYPVKDYLIDVDFRSLYGSDFECLQNAKPQSVFLADGSEIIVYDGRIF
jgi:uncharacterized protein